VRRFSSTEEIAYGGSLEKNSRAREFQNAALSLFVRSPRMTRIGPTTRKDSTMTKFKLMGAAVVLSVAFATPVIAQEAVQEPGLQAFYQSLGVGSQSSATANAMASTRGGLYMSAPVKRVSAKHYAHKM
jgi:hypothetical protein